MFWAALAAVAHAAGNGAGGAAWAQTTASAPARKAGLVTTDPGEVGRALRLWYGQGTAAGNVGDYYDNRDRGHSMLQMSKFPQFELIDYPEQAKARRLDWGLQYRMMFKRVTLGNSSTASSPTESGSNPRRAMTTGPLPGLMYQQYVNSHLYIYPEHRDYDPGRNGCGGYGDLFPANFPYLIISQGSSGSDQQFVEAVAFTLAAFRPETKRRLAGAGLLMPTVQMIFRSCNRGVARPGDYLTGRAHPTVFDGRDVDPRAMVRIAHAMDPGEIPPMVQLKVVEDLQGRDGRDWFDPGLGEKLFDTPCAIARIGRSVQKVRRMVISAEGSYDANKRPLSYHWAVLRGDPNSVKIKPLNENQSLVELCIPFARSRPIWPEADIESPRVDVGACVNHGKYFSAPGFVTMYFLPNEARTYDRAGRIVEADYNFGDSTIGFASGGPRDGSYDVADWKPLMDALSPGRDDPPARLLKKHLTKNQLAELAAAAREFDGALAAEAGPKKARDHAIAARDAARIAADEAAKALGEIRKSGDGEKTAAAEKALLDRQAKQKRTNDAAIEADRGYRAAMVPGLTILTKPRPRLGATRKPAYRHVPVADRALTRTARDCIEEALNAVKDDPTLYVENSAQIAEMLKSIPAADAKAMTDARERLVRGDILAGDDSAGWRLTPLLDGNTPPSDRLSNSQRNRLEWFNIELMNRLLYPGTLRLAFTRNYVPNNLTSPTKTWRDVYRYDNTGRLTGWTRYDADKITNFTADGKVIPLLSLPAHHAAPSDGPYPQSAGRDNVGASVFDLQDPARQSRYTGRCCRRRSFTSRPHLAANDQAQPPNLQALPAKARPIRAVRLIRRARWGFSGGTPISSRVKAAPQGIGRTRESSPSISLSFSRGGPSLIRRWNRSATSARISADIRDGPVGG